MKWVKFYNFLYTQSFSNSFFSGLRMGRKAYRFQWKMNFLYLYLKKKISFLPFLVLVDFGEKVSVREVSKACFGKSSNLWHSAGMHLIVAFVPWSRTSFSSLVYQTPTNVLSNIVCWILLFNHRLLCHCAKKYTFLAAFLMQELKDVFSLHVSPMKE